MSSVAWLSYFAALLQIKRFGVIGSGIVDVATTFIQVGQIASPTAVLVGGHMAVFVDDLVTVSWWAVGTDGIGDGLCVSSIAEPIVAML